MQSAGVKKRHLKVVASLKMRGSAKGEKEGMQGGLILFDSTKKEADLPTTTFSKLAVYLNLAL